MQDPLKPHCNSLDGWLHTLTCCYLACAGAWMTYYLMTQLAFLVLGVLYAC
jgi:hypothetical protein